jgi:predicted RNase H-like HicB family nuclease
VTPKYEIVIHWSEEDRVFVAEVPELSGCMAHGRSREKALSNVQDAMRLWIHAARESGRKLPEPKDRAPRA